MGALILLSGPSGVGKLTIWTRALPQVPEYRVGKSLTTREWRSAEDDLKYIFVTDAEFIEARDNGRLMESDGHMGAYYGALRPADDGPWFYELDVHGAENSKKVYPKAKKVLVDVPSDRRREILRARILGREDMKEAKLVERLDRSEYEIDFSMSHNPDLVLVNADGFLDACVEHLVTFMRFHLA